MSKGHLNDASETLKTAADAADGEIETRLRAQAETLADLADRQFGADHGRLARIEHALREIAADAEEPIAEQIDEAMAAITAFRGTIEGV